MATDRVRAHRVAWVVVMLGCGPAVRPGGPPPEPGPVAKLEPARGGVRSGRQVLVGEMCPRVAEGRPAVAPIALRTATWTDAQAELASVIERGSVPRFAVFGTDGKVAGAFDTLGLAELGAGAGAVASGTYVGGMPCTAEAGGGARTEDPKCVPATGGCGLAVGELARPDDPPPTAAYQTGGACVANGALVVDIDGDGTAEQFALAGVLDGVRSPATEWTATTAKAEACRPAFQLYDIQLTPVIEPGKPIDPKHTVVMDVLGVVDLDGDGRRDLVLALKFPTVRSIVVYTAPSRPAALELAGEGATSPR